MSCQVRREPWTRTKRNCLIVEKMNRAERRAKGIKAKQATYNMTDDALNAIRAEEQKKAAETAFVCMLALPTMVIRDKFGEIIPKKGREETFVNLVLKQYELFNQGYFTLDDLKECLLQETGIKFER